MHTKDEEAFVHIRDRWDAESMKEDAEKLRKTLDRLALNQEQKEKDSDEPKT